MKGPLGARRRRGSKRGSRGEEGEGKDGKENQGQERREEGKKVGGGKGNKKKFFARVIQLYSLIYYHSK